MGGRTAPSSLSQSHCGLLRGIAKTNEQLSLKGQGAAIRTATPARGANFCAFCAWRDGVVHPPSLPPAGATAMAAHDFFVVMCGHGVRKRRTGKGGVARAIQRPHGPLARDPPTARTGRQLSIFPCQYSRINPETILEAPQACATNRHTICLKGIPLLSVDNPRELSECAKA